MTPTTSAPGQAVARAAWPVPVLLVALSAVPVVSGTLRVVQLSGGPAILPADGRYAASPAPVVVHVVASVVFALVGAFQFLPRLRRLGRSWHRRAGRVVALTGLLVAGSGLWLTVGYPLKPGSGELLYLARLVVAPATAACLVLGVAAIRSRDVAGHQAWMMRAYALGLGAGTQVFTQGFGGAVLGSGVLATDLEKIAGWLVNLAVAEFVIRRSRGRRLQ
jgi:uncharacterized membrane protein